MMVNNLPPLSALRAFEAAARHLNFTRAATELGMTQAAVSYQIKLLEERMGGALFLRRPRRLELSELGARLAPGITEGFELMRTTVAAAREQARSTLTISTIQTFAAHWLVHRIGAFQLAHPSIAVRIDTSHELVDFARDPVDICIRAGFGDWPGVESHLLIRSDFTPIMHPDLAAQVKIPADLLKLPLLEANDPWWPIWFSAAGVDFTVPAGSSSLQLDTQALIAPLVAAGKGVALLTPLYFANELANGTLVQPFDLVCTRNFGYWLVYPHARRNAPHIKAFREWVLGEVPDRSQPPYTDVVGARI